MTKFTEGTRVELTGYAERFPFFIVEPGATGTVCEVRDDFTAIKMDDLIDGCEDWDNCLIYNLPEDAEELETAVKVIA